MSESQTQVELTDFSTDEGIDILAEDRARGLSVEIYEEGETMWVTFTDDEGSIVGSGDVEIPEKFQL